MRFLLAAAASALALAATPALADGHMDATSDHHHGEKHSVLDTATFMKHHGEALSGAINHPTRKEDSARDQHRHPAETLAFFHVGPHMKVGEYAPGGGWYSRLLGHYLGGEGQLVGLYANPITATQDETRRQRTRDAAAGFPAEVAGFTGLPAEKFAGMTLETIPDDQKGTFDRILVIRMMHNMMRSNVADSEFTAMRALLKDDGLIGIVQHRAKPDAPYSYTDGSKGYLRQDDVVSFMELQGFELVAASEINANPMDTADHPEGVWEMPPIQRTKRADLAEKGESDRMTLLFKKRP
ncbi:class I SAM-dependent methyltransferase [Parerythrobacter lacustris]|uniref:Methyltransferase n=1 Tax=Parerythrobacter lacustris TaxID=2969984 RepID=A0ABT1XVE2_9SPHN|nr:methyltransferase [Parerythrobacter lacustris]MCR2835229.1 methyltransferase [Parerythrobacter lacustris]